MEFHEFIQLLARKRKTVYGIIAIFILLGIGVIAVQRFKYSANSQLLVVQEYNRTIDAYTASKSNEYLSSVLANVVVSNSFYTKVMESGFDINTSYFGDTTKDQMKQWSRTVSAKSINDSGIIAVSVYHPDRAQAERIDRAINYVLMTQNTAYHGSGDAVKVRLIDQPITSSYPVKPNIPLVLGIAIIFGGAISLIYIYLAPHAQVYETHKYGQRSSYRPTPVHPVSPNFHQDMIGEGGYLEDTEEVTPEDIAQRASMKNILK